MLSKQHRRIHAFVLMLLWSGSFAGCGAEPETLLSPEFAGSSCATCVAQSCEHDLAQCQQDTRCAVYLDCLGRCPLATSGDADPACDQQCQALVPEAGRGTLALVTACRQDGFGSICRTCGHPPITGSPLHEILNQRCGGVEPPDRGADLTHCPIGNVPDRYDHCLDTYCCQSRGSCRNLPDCTMLIQCGQQCPENDHGCFRDCEAKHPQGTVAFQLLSICAGYYCRACEAKPSVSACANCITTRCFDANYQCSKNLDCTKLSNCMGNCVDGPPADNVKCQSDCWPAYPVLAQRQYFRLQECWLGLCALECLDSQ